MQKRPAWAAIAAAWLVLSAAVAALRPESAVAEPKPASDAAAPAPAADATASGIALDAPWKRRVYAWVGANARHSAWGVAHAERNYAMALELARKESLAVDADVLFAAAFLHDVGAIEPHRKAGVDHAVRSVELLEVTLVPTGFPAAKLDAVKATILGHMYTADPAASAEARVFHDADTLDFLGAIGAARILSLTTRHPWAETVAGAVATLRGFSTELPPALTTEAAKAVAPGRVAELDAFLDALEVEAFAGKVY